MKHTTEEVKNFVNQFVELEYRYVLARFDESISNKQWTELVENMKKCYGHQFNYYALINTSRDEDYMNEAELENEKKNLKKRRLFLIRKYENPIFGKGILNTDTSVMWSCFLGSNTDMGAEVYARNMSVGLVNGDLKIISERILNPEKGIDEIDWVYRLDSNLYEEDIVIKKDGTLVETMRIIEPEHPLWLNDYNN